MISDPRMPLMALYPPGYPVLVAVVLAALGCAGELLAAVVPVKLVSVAGFVASIALAYDLLRRRHTRLAPMVALLMACNPQLLHFANEVGTEMPYLLVSLATLWVFKRWERSLTVARLIGLAVMLVTLFHIRSIGLVLAGALMLCLALRGERREALVLGVLVVFGVMPWFVYSSSLPGTGTSVGLGRGYISLYLSSDPYGTERASWVDLRVRLIQNLRIYAMDIGPEVLFPHATNLAELLGPFGALVLLGLSGAVVAGFVLETRHARATEAYAAAFFLTNMGYLWAQSRLIVPVIPFVIYYMLVAVQELLRGLLVDRKTLRGLGIIGMVSVLMTSALVVEARAVGRNLRYGHTLSQWYSLDEEWARYLEAMDWIAANTASAARVICRKADLMYVVSGRQALEYPYSADSGDLAALVDESDASYIVEDQFSWTRTTEQYLRPALSEWQAAEPETLVMVLETGAPQTRVWRVNNTD
jgi:hypothetical protein